MNLFGSSSFRGFPACLLVPGLVLLLGSGCVTSRPGESGIDVSLPRNVFREAGRVPGQMKRVAVMPMAAPGAASALAEGREALEPIWMAALIESARFEFVAVSSEQCRQVTGRASWTGAEVLPKDFFERIRAATGCDAVLLSQLTHYRAYPPVALGWRVQLLEVETRRVWWAVDELFDGGDRAVADAARKYCKAHQGSGPGADPDSILVSPRRFGEFTAAALAASLPSR